MKKVVSLNEWVDNQSSLSEVFKYTEDDINMQYGFYGTLDNHYDNEKKVQKMYLTAINDLMKAYKVSEETAIKILDSREGRHFADFIIDGMVKNVVDAMAKFFGSGAKVFNFINQVSEGFESDSIAEGKGHDEARKLIDHLRSKVFKKLNDDELDEFKKEMALALDLNESIEIDEANISKMSTDQLKKMIKQSEDERVSPAFASQIKAARAELKKRGESVLETETLDVNEGRSINRIQKEYTQVTSEMAEVVTNWKAAKEAGDAKAEANFLARLKELTAKKKGLEKEMDEFVMGKDKDLELAIRD